MRINGPIYNSLYKLEAYVYNNNFSGYDPYDALNADKFQLIKNKILKIVATQIFVYSPINLRYFFRITTGRNPKAIGLFLQGYCKLFKKRLITKEYFESICMYLVNFLLQYRTKEYSSYCWGFNFDWQDIGRFSKKGLPTIVITSYIANSFLDLYEVTKDKRYLEIARSSCQFILKDLHIIKMKQGICFSYTPIDKNIVHNANFLGAALLARVYSITKEKSLLEYSKKACNFSLSNQKQDGWWAYGINPTSQKERKQIDFHQGFILNSICDIINYINPKDMKYIIALEKGAEFYKNMQFHHSGRSLWRLPWRWPVDIHHQAQGILTLSRLYDVLKKREYIDLSEKIVLWTIRNMQDPSGYFYYQKWPLFTNKIPYMRWGQAWMLLALSEHLNKP